VRSQFSDLTSDGEAMVGYYYDSYLNKYLLSFDIKYKAYISHEHGKHKVFNSVDGFILEPDMESIINFEVNSPVSTINTGDVINLNYSGPFPTIRYNSDDTTEDTSISDIKLSFKILRETSVGFSKGISNEQGGGFTIELCANFYDATMDKSITTVYLYNQERHGTWNDNGTELYYIPTEAETELLPRNTVIYFDIPETHKTIPGRTIGSPAFFDFTLSD
ncbi:MAG: hypothetical protein KAT05_13890, partial [Spirochaetes bacterium]|nr:hypothetical protein [Spirochaetota bacterium]